MFDPSGNCLVFGVGFVSVFDISLLYVSAAIISHLKYHYLPKCHIAIFIYWYFLKWQKLSLWLRKMVIFAIFQLTTTSKGQNMPKRGNVKPEIRFLAIFAYSPFLKWQKLSLWLRNQQTTASKGQNIQKKRGNTKLEMSHVTIFFISSLFTKMVYKKS